MPSPARHALARHTLARRALVRRALVRRALAAVSALLLPALLLGALLLPAAPALAGKKAARGELLRTEELGLPPAPTTAARLEIHGDLRDYAGPARLELLSEAPLHLRLTDLAEAEPTELLVESREPVRFGALPGGRFQDRGSLVSAKGKLLLSVQRAWTDGRSEQIVVVGRLAPRPQSPPRDWLRPGTTLFYGISLDDKPITRHEPLGLMVTIEPAEEGARRLSWQADIDPDSQIEDTTLRRTRGERLVPAAIAERGARHSDHLTAPLAGEAEDSTALFASRQARRTLTSMGAAAWQDRDLPDHHLLRAQGPTRLIVQADDALWEIPATAARTEDGGALYLIAEDAQDPLILYARRPGWTLRLLAIGRPAE